MDHQSFKSLEFHHVLFIIYTQLPVLPFPPTCVSASSLSVWSKCNLSRSDVCAYIFRDSIYKSLFTMYYLWFIWFLNFVLLSVYSGFSWFCRDIVHSTMCFSLESMVEAIINIYSTSLPSILWCGETDRVMHWAVLQSSHSVVLCADIKCKLSEIRPERIWLLQMAMT